MQFIYVKNCGNDSLVLEIKEYAHIFKVRRVRLNTILHLRNLEDEFLYTYSLETINKKEAVLHLIEKKELVKTPLQNVHVGWCMVDTKTIEKNLAMLNEMGVSKISFVYSDFSQKNFKLDEERMRRILINSCEQCGRSSLMEFESINSVKEFLTLYPQSILIDFSEKYIDNETNFTTFLVGPEGGFSQNERALFQDRVVFGLKSNVILRSESAVIGVCAKLAL
jgi:16S rRNA (uracil1498-N3)-methyltransferase